MKAHHAIRIVAQKTGLSPHVIRIWEKRYGAVKPSRSDSKRRLYSEEEIERLQYQAASFHTGKRPSKIGRPTKKQRRELDDFMGPPPDLLQ